MVGSVRCFFLVRGLRDFLCEFLIVGYLLLLGFFCLSFELELSVVGGVFVSRVVLEVRIGKGFTGWEGRGKFWVGSRV